MSFNAFDFIRDGLMEELEKQGFKAPVLLEDEQDRAEMMAADEVAYALFYDSNRQRFELKSTTLDEEGRPAKWRELSMWLFEEETGEKADAQSILNDYLDIVKGPKAVSITPKKKKRGKSDERNIDPMFFLNRMANLFPQIKESMREERITYGQVRFAVFAKEKVAPVCEEAIRGHAKGDLIDKVCTLFSDMYENGDLDVRSIVTISILNSFDNETFSDIRDKLSQPLEKDTRYTRKLIGKNIAPEKQKKQKRVMAKLD